MNTTNAFIIEMVGHFICTIILIRTLPPSPSKPNSADFVLVAVILISHKFKMNPDNLATPLAASIGDVVSLSILSFIASVLYENLRKHPS